MTPNHRHAGAWTVASMLAAVLVGAAVAGFGAALLRAAPKGAAGIPADDRLPFVVIAVGAAVACGGALWALGRHVGIRIGIAAAAHRTQAFVIGAIWGAVALIAAGLIERSTTALPGSWGTGVLNDALAGPIEEAAKLLVPVILLLAVPRWRDPRLGAWMVFAAAAVFGVLEGVGYVFSSVLQFLSSTDGTADHVIAAVVSTLNRATVELGHPLYSVGAAGIIWVAARTLPRGKAIGVGLLGFLGAAVLHGFNDAVIGALTKDQAVLGLLASALFLVAVYALWLRPQLSRIARLSDLPAGSGPATA